MSEQLELFPPSKKKSKSKADDIIGTKLIDAANFLNSLGMSYRVVCRSGVKGYVPDNAYCEQRANLTIDDNFIIKSYTIG